MEGVIEVKKFIPYAKLSKKEQRKLDEAKRTAWVISPVTRRPENPKAYNRKKTNREFYNLDGSSFFCLSACPHL